MSQQPRITEADRLVELLDCRHDAVRLLRAIVNQWMVDPRLSYWFDKRTVDEADSVIRRIDELEKLAGHTLG